MIAEVGKSKSLYEEKEKKLVELIESILGEEFHLSFCGGHEHDGSYYRAVGPWSFYREKETPTGVKGAISTLFGLITGSLQELREESIGGICAQGKWSDPISEDGEYEPVTISVGKPEFREKIKKLAEEYEILSNKEAKVIINY